MHHIPLDISFWLVIFVPWGIHDHCSPTNVINRTSSQYLYIYLLQITVLSVIFIPQRKIQSLSKGIHDIDLGPKPKLDTNVMLITLGIDENKFPSVKWNNDYINLSLIIIHTIHCYKICGLKEKQSLVFTIILAYM